ncbi:2'-5' RNA ligase family protein [Aldersonia sp. NBC_00410]|uniref:2'-5' RNA ligase family protein n=1 Tax=Aldersonia sp. NBC_00410 TaxID=2975954 RepID=UPI002252BD30|nr:2'-5' RNA ligase family protein [Aldersonia sp. NBC_00410]MCX5046497.1 2'-5' RNA ligase family protein [Aldersonia sp. NBC_00410]
MVQSVELLLDRRTDELLRRQWRLIADAGVRSQAGVHAESNRPHITVAVASEIWPRIDRRLAAIEFTPLPIRVGGLLVFGHRQAILVRLVVPSEPLLALHRTVAGIVAECPGIPAHTGPGEWTPHITLARRIPRDRLGDALSAVLDEPEIAGTVEGVRRWDGAERREWRIV